MKMRKLNNSNFKKPINFEVLLPGCSQKPFSISILLSRVILAFLMIFCCNRDLFVNGQSLCVEWDCSIISVGFGMSSGGRQRAARREGAQEPHGAKNAPPNHEHQIDHHTFNLIITFNAYICKFSYYIKELQKNHTSLRHKE